MYRVELKVPLAPILLLPLRVHVPNVPCGVESWLCSIPQSLLVQFLMYRVELKAHIPLRPLLTTPDVPNVPCGVESKHP